MKIGFLGTPELAKQVLQYIIDTDGIEVCFVITNPDKPVGRKKILTPTPVRILSEKHKIPLFTPKKIRGNTDLYETIKQFDCDYFVVVAYGKILPADFLEIPKKIALNVHGSLLPKYRGASPIQSALLNGESETGVSIMQMSEGMDEGDILSMTPIKIKKNETSLSLFETFGKISPQILVKTLRDFDDGNIQPIPQNNTEATYCTKITKQDGHIDWNLSAKDIYHHWQAYTPWPGIYSFFEEKKIAFEQIDFELSNIYENVEIGRIVDCGGKIGVVCGQGLLYVEVVKLAGKQSQSIVDFVRGHQQFIGYIFEKKEE